MVLVTIKFVFFLQISMEFVYNAARIHLFQIWMEVNDNNN